MKGKAIMRKRVRREEERERNAEKREIKASK